MNFFYQNLILSFKLLMILIRGIWKKYFYFFWLKEGTKYLQNVLNIETWSYIILNHDCLIFKEFNNGTKLMTSDTCIFFSYLLLRSPFWVFNLTDFFRMPRKNRVGDWSTNRKMTFCPGVKIFLGNGNHLDNPFIWEFWESRKF